METVIDNAPISFTTNKPFWVIWGIELWERFGFYGVQAILAIYFVNELGYSESQSFYIFGTFSAFAYGFVWIGGWVGDKYLGAKRTLVLGAIILMLSYAMLSLSNHHTVFYALAGIIIGNALFKANPSSLISKMYVKGDPALDSAMTLYYMAINIGSTLSMAITPIIAEYYGWSSAFWLCALGLLLGLVNYFVYKKLLITLGSEVDKKPINYKRLVITTIMSLISIGLIAQLLNHTKICNFIVYSVVTGAFVYFIKIALSFTGIVRIRMLVAFVLIMESILFFVLYNQMPTSLTFFALHNINNHFGEWTIPAAEYQVLNPIIIVLMSPILVKIYRQHVSTHVTKFCMGMTLCAAGFLVLAIPQYTTTTGLASPLWMLLTYFLQSVGELLIAGLGLAMIAELCPSKMTGFVMGIWWLTNMLAGPIGAWVGALTAPVSMNGNVSALATMPIYSQVFEKLGLVTALVTLFMWMIRPKLNRLLQSKI